MSTEDELNECREILGYHQGKIDNIKAGIDDGTPTGSIQQHTMFRDSQREREKKLLARLRGEPVEELVAHEIVMEFELSPYAAFRLEQLGRHYDG